MGHALVGGGAVIASVVVFAEMDGTKLLMADSTIGVPRVGDVVRVLDPEEQRFVVLSVIWTAESDNRAAVRSEGILHALVYVQKVPRHGGEGGCDAG